MHRCQGMDRAMQDRDMCIRQWQPLPTPSPPPSIQGVRGGGEALSNIIPNAEKFKKNSFKKIKVVRFSVGICSPSFNSTFKPI